MWPGSLKSAHVVAPGVHRGPVGPAGPSPHSAPTAVLGVAGPQGLGWAPAGGGEVTHWRLETCSLSMLGGEGALSSRTQPPFTVGTLLRPHLRAVLPSSLSSPVARVSVRPLSE